METESDGDTTVTGVFQIRKILWTDGYRQALCEMKFKRFPSCTHMKIMLASVSDSMASKLPGKYQTMLKKVVEKEKSSPRQETELVSQLKLFHYKHSEMNLKNTFVVFDYFPLFSDSLEYELTLEKKETSPQFIQASLEGRPAMRIKHIHGIYRDKKKRPAQAILWMAMLQSNPTIKRAALKKYTKFVDWQNLTSRDVEIVPDFREPRMNHRSKQFIRSVIRDTIDTDTMKLVPWIRPAILKLLTPLEKRTLVRTTTETLETALDFNFQIQSPQLFALWFGHEPCQHFEDAWAFKHKLKNHMYGQHHSSNNKYLLQVSVENKRYVGSSGTIGVPGKEDTEPEVYYTLASTYTRYSRVIQRFINCEIVIGTPDVPKGLCIVSHPDDAVYWRQTADVDEVCLLSDLKHKAAGATEVTLYNSHKFDFQHWVLLEKFIDPCATITVCGRLDQHNTGKVGQVFRDLVEVNGGVAKAVHGNAWITNDINFVKSVDDLPQEVEQVFTSAWAKTVNEKWLHERSQRRFNRVYLYKPTRIRTIKFRTDGGFTKFKEQDEAGVRLFDLKKHGGADVVPLQKWNGRLLEAAAFIPDPDAKNNFDLFTVRTLARKIYYVGIKTLPADSGRLPSRLTLRSAFIRQIQNKETNQHEEQQSEPPQPVTI